jgi:hypothetical protein
VGYTNNVQQCIQQWPFSPDATVQRLAASPASCPHHHHQNVNHLQPLNRVVSDDEHNSPYKKKTQPQHRQQTLECSTSGWHLVPGAVSQEIDTGEDAL